MRSISCFGKNNQLTYLSSKKSMSKTQLTKDRAKKQIVVERVFQAPRGKVWRAWTESALLDQWWAPKPWKAETASFDFSEGGHWHYSMNGPGGEKVWAWIGYLSINPEESFTAEDAFCDEAGKKNTEMPVMHWENEFRAEGEATKVVITITFASEGDMNKIIEMGFEEGFSMGLDNLDALLGA